ncbi:hypothetical protein [Oligoflexus tunisiensis]|uniref:hypothetical protein n=1 Tax=Oligoflexus tunisiensis TaxID=708132 RepID=UPI001C405360|nr:hypothetical protein [Oligoflexus tunisiensis]
MPKDWQKLSVIELYRSRALVRTGLFGALLHPFVFLFESSAWDIWQMAGIAFMLVMIPLVLMSYYRSTGRLNLCAFLYLVYCTGICAWAQIAAGTIHAMYWVWITFLIVFSVLVLGVKQGAAYTVLATGLFWFVLQNNVQYGHTIGRFSDQSALVSSLAAQVLALQVCFLLLMMAYDVIRNRAELRAVLLRFTDDEAARLATVGERMGGMAQDLQAQLAQFQQQLQSLETVAKRNDAKIEDVQKVARELQESTEKLSAISQRAQG